MEFYRCRICGETYLGDTAPSRCPFCGVTADHLVLTQAFHEDVNDVQLTELERADLMTAIGLERDNARFYRALSIQGAEPGLASAYKRLANVEAEHCSLFCKLADVVKPSDLLEPSTAPDDWCENIAESLEREQRAADFYSHAAERATNERIVEVLAAISAVERDHIQLDGVAARIAGCR